MTETLLTRHIPGCTVRGFQHSDAAKRMADGITQAYADHGMDAVGRWKTVRLADGGVDRALYDTHRDAVRSVPNMYYFCYLKLVMSMGMSICEAEMYLKYNRLITSVGGNMPDPDKRTGGKTPILPRTIEGMTRAISALQGK